MKKLLFLFVLLHISNAFALSIPPNCVSSGFGLNYSTSTNAYSCVNFTGSGSGVANSISNADGTLTISPTTGAVVSSLNLAHANTWTANGASSASAITFSGTPFVGTGTTSTPLMYFNQGTAPTTWNSTATGGTYLGWNGVASFAGNYIDIHNNGGASIFSVGPSSFSVSSAINPVMGGLVTFNRSGSTSNGAFYLTGSLVTGGTGTTSIPQFKIEPTGTTAVTTWNTGATGLGMNLASSFAGNFLDFHTGGGAQLFGVSSTGAITAPSWTQSGAYTITLGSTGTYSNSGNNNATVHIFQSNNQSQSNGALHEDFKHTFNWVPTSGSSPLAGMSLAYTINETGTASGAYTGILENITETAVLGTGNKLIDLQVGSTTKFNVDNSGNIVFAGGSITSPTDITIRADNSNKLFINGSGTALRSDNSLFWSSTTTPSSTPDIALGRAGAANLRMGAPDAAAPVAQTLSMQNVVAGTSNTAGTNFTQAMSQGTGTGVGGSYIVQVAPAGTTGTSQNALAPALTIDSTKLATFAGNGTFTGNLGVGSAASGTFALSVVQAGQSQAYFGSTGAHSAFVIVDNAAGASGSFFSLADSGNRKWDLFIDGGTTFHITDVVNSKNFITGNPGGTLVLGAAQTTNINQAGALTVGGSTTTNGVISNGTKFTTSGCSVSATTGGATAGTFTLGANVCTVIVTMNGATGLTAPNGWTCSAHDKTTPADLIGGESSSTTTTASFTIPVTTGATDVISFSCTGY